MNKILKNKKGNKKIPRQDNKTMMTPKIYGKQQKQFQQEVYSSTPIKNKKTLTQRPKAILKTAKIRTKKNKL